MEVRYGANNTDDSSCHSFYIIKFSSSTYILQENLIINGKVIYSGEMVCERTYFFPINIIYNCYVLQITNPLTHFSLITIIYGNLNVICYDSNDVLPLCLRSKSQNDYNTFKPDIYPQKNIII